MKPRILISRSPESSGLYEAAVERAGGIPLSFYCPDPELPCDGLILGGGGDVDPSEFLEENHGSVEIDRARDQAELELVNRFVQEGKPILGICRGHQVVNIAMGGTIYQDINNALLQVHALTEDGKSRVHPVRNGAMTVLESLYGSRALVNSSHHQAVYQFGQGLYATAWDEAGVVEAMQHAGLPIWTVQFHPEQLNAEDGTLDGQKLFDFFVEQCKKQH